MSSFFALLLGVTNYGQKNKLAFKRRALHDPLSTACAQQNKVIFKDYENKSQSARNKITRLLNFRHIRHSQIVSDDLASFTNTTCQLSPARIIESESNYSN